MVMCVSTAGMFGRGRGDTAIGFPAADLKGWAGFAGVEERQSKEEAALEAERKVKALEKQRLRMQQLGLARKSKGLTSKGRRRSQYGKGVGEYHNRKRKAKAKRQS